MLLFLGVCERERPDPDSRKSRGPRRHGRSVLDLAGSADNAAGHAPEKRSAAETRVRAFYDGLELILELRRDEQEREIGDRALKWRKCRAERVLRRGKAGAPRGDARSDAKIGKASGHALSLSLGRRSTPSTSWSLP